jgi:hypothetical protein
VTPDVSFTASRGRKYRAAARDRLRSTILAARVHRACRTRSLRLPLATTTWFRWHCGRTAAKPASVALPARRAHDRMGAITFGASGASK